MACMKGSKGTYGMEVLGELELGFGMCKEKKSKEVKLAV